ALNQGSTCTVKVTDTDLGSQSAPAGTASFSSNGTGGFSGSPCTLSARSEERRVGKERSTRSAGEGWHKIKDSYSASDSVHTNSADAGGYGLTVTPRWNATSVTACAPPTVALNQGSTCTVKVTDTDLGSQSAPAGTASFSSNGTGGFSGSPCTLSAGGSNYSTCTVTYTPSRSEERRVGKECSSGCASVHTKRKNEGGYGTKVRNRSTSSSGTGCAPPSVREWSSAACTSNLTDTDLGSQSAPAGTASFSSNGTGGFSGSPCTLSAGGSNYSTCTVTYTPSAGAGTHTIKDRYSTRDSLSHMSAAEAGYGLTVTTRPTSTIVPRCAPPTVALHQLPSFPTRRSSDLLGSQSAPAGTASFSSNGTGGFSGSPCTLSAGGSNYSTCTVTYTPSAGAGTHTI